MMQHSVLTSVNTECYNVVTNVNSYLVLEKGGLKCI